MLKEFTIFDKSLESLQNSKLLINTINAYSYNVSQKDALFKKALLHSDILIPDGVGVVWAAKLLFGQQLKKIAGADLFYYEMNRLEKIQGKCYFFGSSEDTLLKIKEKAKIEFPNVNIATYSPPYKPAFTREENEYMIHEINEFAPDVLFVGMTAPKQEKWAYTHFKELNVGHVCSIGAVFDFYAGKVERAPKWMIKLELEWFYRLFKEPKRMWRRYILGNPIFIVAILREKIFRNKI
ncbi:WecB/TagA/CpsF family glycosyltransferase [Polaribacter glomeratus]|uniref:Beta-1,4-N-acetyl-mannosaminyltransferase n=1 Tax=Polaribacter glomeratus TaxID=102 RepID=A0A2S7WUU8_9FLAO|nr:WecB/TagA/CpsF family glycosyltransferase [Polaribacter glomeratus]PQJ81102.1 beta-1,4-N-acetyl- mannosaminyltransferase [Polaribacter glomeratus]TXD65655.1 WecB/TagA/CpsF family glycosyltransferase [Polaribacter glomeratus]